MPELSEQAQKIDLILRKNSEPLKSVDQLLRKRSAPTLTRTEMILNANSGDGKKESFESRINFNINGPTTDESTLKGKDLENVFENKAFVKVEEPIPVETNTSETKSHSSSLANTFNESHKTFENKATIEVNAKCDGVIKHDKKVDDNVDLNYIIKIIPLLL